MNPRELDEVDALYALPLEGFIAERDRLSKQIAASGDKERARTIKAFRKPSVVAWVLNQIARSHRDLLERLIATGGDIARSLGSADPAGAREAQTRRRALLKEAGEISARILRDGGHATGGHVDKVRSILLQATTDEQAADAVATGRLDREPEADAFPDAFETDDVVDGADAPDAQERRRRERLEAKSDRLAAEAEAAAQRATQLARDAESARIAADAAEELAATAQRAADRALRHLEDAQAELRENG